MPFVLTLRLAAPLQAWGAQSRFARRTTERAPTKSGVIGLLAAARGLRRTDPLDEFAGLRFGVRIDQPGSLLRDFHTAHDDSGSSMPLSERFYLQDAVFLVGLESTDRTQLEDLATAIAHPHFPLFLGRRACPPDGPIQTRVTEGSLESVLRDAPWMASPRHKELERLSAARTALDTTRRRGRLGTLLIEPGEPLTEGLKETVNDEPVSFDPRRRAYSARAIVRPAPVVFEPLAAQDADATTTAPPHDPLAAVRAFTKPDTPTLQPPAASTVGSSTIPPQEDK